MEPYLFDFANRLEDLPNTLKTREGWECVSGMRLYDEPRELTPARRHI